VLSLSLSLSFQVPLTITLVDSVRLTAWVEAAGYETSSKVVHSYEVSDQLAAPYFVPPATDTSGAAIVYDAPLVVWIRSEISQAEIHYVLGEGVPPTESSPSSPPGFMLTFLVGVCVCVCRCDCVYVLCKVCVRIHTYA
jgi:hypothetical protein